MIPVRILSCLIVWSAILCGVQRVDAQICTTKMLQFGKLLAGQTSTVDKLDAKALCYFTGLLSTGTYQVSFTLPTSMVSGSNSIPVSFSTTDGTYSTFRASWFGPVEYNPATTFTTQSSTRYIVIRLGATVHVPQNAAPGSYVGPIVLTIKRIGT